MNFPISSKKQVELRELMQRLGLREADLEERFVRSSGPGGQNVNKVSSAVQLRFDARHSPALTNAVFLRLKPLAGRRMTRDGVIVITANRFRSQERNREDATDRLIDLIRKATVPPKHRRPTRPSRGAKQRRLDSKRRQGNMKKNRGKVSGLD